jgi:hypothetical protein
LRPPTPLESAQAIRRILESLGASVSDTGYLCCIMMIDLLSPGISTRKIFLIRINAVSEAATDIIFTHRSERISS